MGTGKLFTLLLGLSPVVAVLLYFVLQQQADQNKKIDSTSLEMNKDFAKFDKDFANEKLLNTNNVKAKVVYKKQVEDANNTIQKIEKQQQAVKNIKVKNTKEVLNEIDNELKDMDQNDFDF